MKHVTFLALCLLAHGALAQQQSDSKPESKQGQDDLDVTMQIIVDPDAKLPDEVVRRIPLPERKSVDSPATNADKNASKEAAADSKQSAREAKELAKEASQSAKEEAAEQREQARRARAEERERERNHPPGNPNPPGRPPH
ncbi:MAG TPA: hypothetical protein VIU34_35960 [Steroidobacter sp.]